MADRDIVVLLGAFQRLLEDKNQHTGSIGFGSQPRQRLDYGSTQITAEDLVRFGMRQELAGRVTRVVCMDPLTVQDLARIARGEAAQLSRQTGKRISIDESALLSMAETAHRKGLGARWIKHSLGNALDKLIYEHPDATAYRLEFLTPKGGEDCQASQQPHPIQKGRIDHGF